MSFGGRHDHHSRSSNVQKSADWSHVSAEEYRLASCGRCRIQLRFCATCDRGQRFCDACRPEQRRDSLQRAGAAYRIKPRARRLHATRQARYRERQRAKCSAQIVTHQLVTQPPSAPMSFRAPGITPGRKDNDDDRCSAARCSSCGVLLPAWARGTRRRRRMLTTRAPRVPRGPPH